MPGTYRPSPRYPSLLGARIAQGEHLARALQRLSGSAVASDPSFLWLLGRADEVRTFIDEIAREWSEGSIDNAQACEAIRSYVGATHLALHRRYGGYGASCCGPLLEPFGRRSVGRAPLPALRPRLESGVQELATEDPPASRARPKWDASYETRKQAATIPPQRKSAG